MASLRAKDSSPMASGFSYTTAPFEMMTQHLNRVGGWDLSKLQQAQTEEKQHALIDIDSKSSAFPLELDSLSAARKYRDSNPAKSPGTFAKKLLEDEENLRKLTLK